jgi:hypothetical protein
VYYVLAETGISAGTGCQPIGPSMTACRVTQGLKRYDIATGGGDDRVELTGATSGGSPGHAQAREEALTRAAALARASGGA